MFRPNQASQITRIILALALFTALSFGGAIVPSLPDTNVEVQLTRVLECFDVQSLKPGYGICLFDAHGPIWSHYQGFADLEGRTPFSADTRFRVGAISELFTAIRVLQLVDEGRMELDAPIARYTPDVFAGAPPRSVLGQLGELKVGILLSHLSGTPADLFLSFRGYEPFQNIGRFLEGTRPQFPPGTKYIHASGFIDLLGLAVQEQEGRPFEQGMRKALFDPLGMASSSFQFRNDPQNAAMRYRSGQQDDYLAQISDWNEVQAPSSSMVSSLKDLVAFYSMVLGRGSCNGQPILSPGSISAMFSSKSNEVARRQGIRVGYVWMLSLPELAHLGPVAWYSGKFIAHRNVVILAEDLGIGIVVATNSWHIFEHQTIFPLATEILKTYAESALGKPAPAPVVRQAVPLPATLGRQIVGNYVSPFGIYRVTVKKGHVDVSTNIDQWRLGYYGENQFLPEDPAEIDRVVFSPPESMTAFLRNGIVISAENAGKGDQAAFWKGAQGMYRIADRSDYQKVHVYAFSIASRDGLLMIQGDDGKDYLVRALSRRTAEIVCNEASQFFGKSLEVKSGKEVLLGGVPFLLTSQNSQ